jgi:hypothetical protein
MSPTLRSSLCIAACVGSALAGAYAIHRGWGGISSVALDVACAWSLAGGWEGGRFTRAEWARLNRPVSNLLSEAKLGKFPRYPPLARVMSRGSGILLIVGIAGLFV